MAGNGTLHHKLKSWTGIGLIITLPIALCGLVSAIPGGAAGFKAWIGSPFGAATLFLFMTTALWYCKLEFDEVIMDYFDGGLRKFALLANKTIEFLVWLIAAFAIYKLSFGA